MQAEWITSLPAVLTGNHPMANLANFSAMVWEAMEDINWAGFYLLDDGALGLGPFQGKLACTRIEIGRGVCGTTLRDNETLVVPDVHAFPGHIACDAASRSEIVIPLQGASGPIGVLDIDSPTPDRFTQADRTMLEQAVAILQAHTDFSRLHYSLR